MKTLTFAVSGMHCASCGMLIDQAVEEIAGVDTSATDLRRERTIVVCADQVNAESLIAAIHAAGYEAVAADAQS